MSGCLKRSASDHAHWEFSFRVLLSTLSLTHAGRTVRRLPADRALPGALHPHTTRYSPVTLAGAE